jgi:aminoglycoside phosphotransferase (APT) family kinase protein
LTGALGDPSDDALARSILAALNVAPASLRREARGADSLVWRVEAAGRALALRVQQTGYERVAARELACLLGASWAGLPVPGVEAALTWQGRPVLLMEWAPGRALLDELARRPAAWLAAGRSFGRLQARVNATRAPPELVAEGPRWIGRAGDPHADLQELLRRATGGSDRLLHLDFHPLNVTARGFELTGILDWSNASAGDPRADYARTLSILRLDPGVARLPLPVRLLVGVFERAWAAGYRAAAGRPHGLAPFLAWAGAYLLADLGRRYGPPDSPRHPLHRAVLWTGHWRARSGLPAQRRD